MSSRFTKSATTFVVVAAGCWWGCAPPAADDVAIGGAGGAVPQGGGSTRTGGAGSGVGAGGAIAAGTGGRASLTGGSSGSGGGGASAGVGTGGAMGVGTGGRASATGGSGVSSGGSGAGAGSGGGASAAGGNGGRGGGSGGRAAGTGGIPVSTDPNDPLNKFVTCSTGRNWDGNAGQSMLPGESCQGCHQFSISGTLYATGHEVTWCNGQKGGNGLTIVVTDATGRVVNITPNSVGNFYYEGTISYPFTAKVVRGTAVRPMLTPQMNGDCNTCHTAEGMLGAPGRVVPPP